MEPRVVPPLVVPYMRILFGNSVVAAWNGIPIFTGKSFNASFPFAPGSPSLSPGLPTYHGAQLDVRVFLEPKRSSFTSVDETVDTSENAYKLGQRSFSPS